MRRLISILLLFFAAFSIVSAADWPQWRGLSSDGSASELGLVSDLADDDAILWSCDLPGPSAGTPIVNQGKVFVSSTELDTNALLGLCIDEKTGKELWRKTLGDSQDRTISRGNMAASSPASDDQRVYFIYDSGEISALDHDGEILWQRNLEKEFGCISVKFGYSSTPLVYDDKLYIPVMRRGKSYRGDDEEAVLDSFLLAVDAKTGKTVFRHVRYSAAIDESLDSYTSPILFTGAGKPEILIVGADAMSSHCPDTGNEFWRYTYNEKKSRVWRHIPSPVTNGDTIYSFLPRGEGMFAIKSGQGSLSQADLVWSYDEEKTSDSPSPLYYQGCVYILDGTGSNKLRCLDAKTGNLKWENMLDGRRSYYASPTAADGKIYCVSEAGRIVVVEACAENFNVIAQRDLDDGPCRSSIAIANGKLFVRTGKKLYCFGKK